jgi:hypothetical protein
MGLLNTPDYKVLRYTMNPATGRYEKQPTRIAFNKLPYELKVEQTQDPRIKAQGAEQVITGRFVNKKREFFTGMRQTMLPGWYYGNDFEFVKDQKVNSLVIVAFTDDDARLTIYYFNRYYKQSADERESFVNAFIRNV